MTAHRTDYVLSVVDLIDRPGASRRVEIDAPVPDGLELATATVHDPVRLSGVVESVVEGLLVRGTVRAGVTLECSRCLVELIDEVTGEVAELFTDATDAEPDGIAEPGYEILGDRLDLEVLLRDALVPAVPYRPLCKPDCAGLCATCGASLNEGECGCSETVADSRWKALEALELPRED